MPDEMLDVVDDQNIIINQQKRSVVHKYGLQHRGVHIFLFAPDGKLIVQQRSSDRETFPSSLDCSVSEHVRAGEDFLDAALRGLREELGLDGIQLHSLVTFKMKYGPNDNEISRLYQGAAEPRQIRFDPVEVAQVAAYELPELLKQMDAGEIAFSGWFKQLIFWALDRPSELQVMETHSRLQIP